MIVRFTVPGAPCGKNAAYARLRKDQVTRTGRKMGLILSQEGRNYKARVRRCGWEARIASEWPSDPWIPKRVRITVAMYGTRHDAGAATQIIKDGLEGVYFENDRVVSQGPEDPSIRDGSEPRVEVTMELLEVRTQAEAVALRDAQRKRRERAFAKKLGVVQQSAKKARKN